MKEETFLNKTSDNNSSFLFKGIDHKLMEILVCPLTKTTLEYDVERQELVSRVSKLAYPIRDGIPIMLPEEARRIE